MHNEAHTTTGDALRSLRSFAMKEEEGKRKRSKMRILLLVARSGGAHPNKNRSNNQEPRQQRADQLGCGLGLLVRGSGSNNGGRSCRGSL